MLLTLAPWMVEGWRTRWGRRVLVLQKLESPKLQVHEVRGTVWGHGSDPVWGPTQFSSSLSVMSDSLRLNGLQHARPPCPSPTPRVYSNSCPLSQWCHPTISYSAVPFSSCPQSLPASGSFQMSQFLTSGGQSIGASASALVLPMNIQDWFPFGWTGWISLQSKGLSRVFSKHHSSKASILRWSAFFIVQLSHPYVTTGKTIALTRWTFVGKVMSLLFNMLSSLVLAFLPRSKCLLISWLQTRKQVSLTPDGWDVHLPIHRKALNSLTWDPWFPFINSHLLTFWRPGLCCRNPCKSWLPSSPLRSIS